MRKAIQRSVNRPLINDLSTSYSAGSEATVGAGTRLRLNAQEHRMDIKKHRHRILAMYLRQCTSQQMTASEIAYYLSSRMHYWPLTIPELLTEHGYRTYLESLPSETTGNNYN